jgi:hypothetical protein
MLEIKREHGFVILPAVTNVLIPVVNNQVIFPVNPKEFLDKTKEVR